MNVRGQRRLAVLRGAAGDVLLDEGFHALTHRALSTRSGVPVASTAHYFPTVDALALAAVEEMVGRWVDQARSTVAALPARRTSSTAAARAVVAVVLGPAPTTAGLTAFYERYVQAGRVPALCEPVAAGNAELRLLLAQALDRCGRPVTPGRARLLLAALDGLVLSALAEGEQDPAATVVRPLARLLDELSD